MADKSSRTPPPAVVTEWVGGIVSLPATIAGEGVPFTPEVLLWLDPGRGLGDEAVLGMTVARPDEMLEAAPVNLRETMVAPAAGPPRVPARVRVSSEALADALRAALPELEVVVAATPEIEIAGAGLAAHLGGGVEERSWLAGGLPAPAVGAFFEAMAGLWEAEPWEALAGEERLIRVSVEAFDVRDAVAVVIGSLGESLGVLLFDSVADRDRFVALGMAAQTGNLPAVTALGGEIGMPAHAGLSFDPVEDVPPTMREERETHRWALADEDAFPSLLLFGTGLEERAPTTRDLALAEALARAVARVVTMDDAFVDAWHDGGSVERTLTVETAEGQVEVVLGLTNGDGDEVVDAVPERVYRLKIELEEIDWKAPEGEVSRTLDCPGDLSLLELHDVIQDAFGWDDDHLFTFQTTGKLRDRKHRYVGGPMGDVPSWNDEPRSVTWTTLDELGLKSRRVMRYVFDEHIVHKITVRTVRAGTEADTALPEEVDAVGTVPGQYGEPED